MARLYQFVSVVSPKVGSDQSFIAICVLLLYLSIGAGWLGASSNQGPYANSYNVLDISGMVGPYVSSGTLPSNSTIDGQLWVVLLPLIVSQGPLLLAEWTFPFALILSFVSLFRWKLMLAAGVAGILSGSAWILGIEQIRLIVVAQLDSWYGYGGKPVSSSIDPQVGSYLSIIGGLLLVVGFFLSRYEKLETPFD